MVVLVCIQDVILIHCILPWEVDADPPGVSQVAQSLGDAVHELIMDGSLWEGTYLADAALCPVLHKALLDAGLGDVDPASLDDVGDDGQALGLVGSSGVVGDDGEAGGLQVLGEGYACALTQP